MTEGSVFINMERWSVHVCECVCKKEEGGGENGEEKGKEEGEGEGRLLYKGYYKLTVVISGW